MNQDNRKGAFGQQNLPMLLPYRFCEGLLRPTSPLLPGHLFSPSAPTDLHGGLAIPLRKGAPPPHTHTQILETLKP